MAANTGHAAPPTAAPPAQPLKAQRILACVLCQQRKVKCSRTFPCSNCAKSGVACVPATLTPRRRRRRYSERELLDCLRKYESLLHTHSIQFDSLFETRDEDSSAGPHDQHGEDTGTEVDGNLPGNAGRRSPSPSSEGEYEAKSFWEAVNGSPSRDLGNPGNPSSHVDTRRDMIRKVWEKLNAHNGSILFTSTQKPAYDVSVLHPQPSHIFRLWQTYLDNIDPLLKITHAPTTQSLIVEAVSDTTKVSPAFNALLFSIYCSAIASTTDEDCQSQFSLPKETLLRTYQSACEQALVNCNFLKTNDIDCLTAYFLYLISQSDGFDPRSLYSMLGVAMRIGQRLQLHIEMPSSNSSVSALDAERRRRLWWAMVLFDTRVGELADYRPAALDPTWNCRTPSNVNDSDLRPEAKTAPAPQQRPSEALFAAVRAEVGDFIRYSAYHITLTTPALKPLARDAHRAVSAPGTDMFSSLEKTLQEKYLQYCDLENPIHLMAYWAAKGSVAKARLTEYFSRMASSSSGRPSVAQLDDAYGHCIAMLEYDTKVVSSPLTKRFRWLLEYYFPFPAFIYICRDLTERITGDQARKAWQAMDENCEARFGMFENKNEIHFEVFSRIILQAWDAFKKREPPSGDNGSNPQPPSVVARVQKKVDELAAASSEANETETLLSGGIQTPLPIDSGGSGLVYGGMPIPPAPFSGPATMAFMPGLTTDATLNVGANPMSWQAAHWGWGTPPGW